MYRLDRNWSGGGIRLCVREDIPPTLVNTELFTKAFGIEINSITELTFSLHMQAKWKLNFNPPQRNRQKLGQLFF